MASTASIGELGSSWSSSSVTIERTTPSSSATRRTLRLGLTSFRCLACVGGSRYTMEPVDSAGLVKSVSSTPFPEQNVAGSLETACTSAWRARAHIVPAGPS